MADIPPTSGGPPHRLTSSRPVDAPCESLSIFARTAYYVLRVDNACRLLVAQRTAVRFEHIADIEECFQAVERLLIPIARPQFVLLVDVRGGPSRNDPAFESIVKTCRGKLLLGFARNAALASSAVGRLQIQRYAKTDGRDVFVTDREASAFESLGLAIHPLPLVEFSDKG